MSTRFPVVHYRWDVDKTYIQTDFDSVRDLLRMWRQRAEDKTNIPGAPALLRELLASDDRARRVSFISGSPRQMREVLMKKFELDGIQPSTLVLKPNLGNLLQLKLRDVHNQVGYKLDALLTLRTPGESEFLFGDDSEQDALIYSLYADLIRGAIPADELQEFLTLAGLYPAAVERLMRRYLSQASGDGQVERIFIHLDRRSPVQRFVHYGWQVVPVYNWFQAAVVLKSMGQLELDSLSRIAAAMATRGYDARRLATSIRDMIRRGYVDPDAFERLNTRTQAREEAHVHPILREALAMVRALPLTRYAEAVVRDAPPDYRAIFEGARWRRVARTQQGRPWLHES